MFSRGRERVHWERIGILLQNHKHLVSGNLRQ